MDKINKVIIFDSGTIINFALNGLFQEIEELKKIFNGKFLITKEVKREIIDKPIEIKKFELEALKIKELLDKKIFEMPASIGINEEQLTKETEVINNKANSIFLARGNYIHIVDLAESSCLALSKKLNSLNIENLIAVDERTIRILSEKPENLVKILESKLHTKIVFSQEKLYEFREFNFIRSTEIMYIVYKKNIIKIKDKRLLDALLYALKYHGCSISDEEIQEIKKLD